MDALIGRLLEKIALRGRLGATRVVVDALVRDCCAAAPWADASQPQGLLPTTADGELCERVWNALSAHADICVEQRSRSATASAGSSGGPSAQKTNPSPEPASPSVLTPDNGVTLVARDGLVWHTIAGHGRDLKRLPSMSFELLRLIAAAGADGIFQPELVRLSGQDKRSVPRRTDFLNDAGYIEKRGVQGKGGRTSVCTLKRLVKSEQETEEQALLSVFSGDMIYTHKVIPAIMAVVKKDGVVPVSELQDKMGIVGKRSELRALQKFLHRMENLGLVRRISARVEQDNGSAGGGTVKCVQFVRDASAEDESVFVHGSGAIVEPEGATKKLARAATGKAGRRKSHARKDGSADDGARRGSGSQETRGTTDLSTGRSSSPLAGSSSGDGADGMSPPEWPPAASPPAAPLSGALSEGNDSLRGPSGESPRSRQEASLSHGLDQDAEKSAAAASDAEPTAIVPAKLAGATQEQATGPAVAAPHVSQPPDAEQTLVAPRADNAAQGAPVDNLDPPANMPKASGRGRGRPRKPASATPRAVNVPRKLLPDRPVAIFHAQARSLAERQARKELLQKTANVEADGDVSARAAAVESAQQVGKAQQASGAQANANEEEARDYTAVPAKGHKIDAQTNSTTSTAETAISTAGEPTTTGIEPGEAGPGVSETSQPKPHTSDPEPVFEGNVSRPLPLSELGKLAGKRAVEEGPGISESKRAKRRRSGREPAAEADVAMPPGFTERVTELEKEFFCMDRPGVYLNPPQYILWKQGRQRSCALVVFKFDRLKELPWFTGPTTDRSLYLPRGGERTRANGANDDQARVEDEPPVSMEAVYWTMVTPTSTMTPQPPSNDTAPLERLRPAPVLKEPKTLVQGKPRGRGRPRKLPHGVVPSLFEFVDPLTPDENFGWIKIMQKRFLRMGRRLPGFVKRETRHSRTRKALKRKNALRNLQNASRARREKDERLAQSSMDMQDDDAQDVEMIDAANAAVDDLEDVERIVAASTAVNDAQQTKNVQNTASTERVTRRARRARQPTQKALDAEVDHTDSYSDADDAEDRSSDIAEPSIEVPASDEFIKNDLGSLGGKGVGVFKEDIIIRIIRDNGGAYPDAHESLYLAFLAEWRKTNKEIPESSTIKRLVTLMARKGKIRKMMTNFPAGSNIVIISVVCLPEINGSSQAFLDAVNHAKDAHPNPYLPAGVQVTNLPSPEPKRPVKRVNPYHLDESVTVKPSRLPVDDSFFTKASKAPKGAKSKSKSESHETVSRRHERIQQQKERLAVRRSKQQTNRDANIAAAKERRDQPQQSAKFDIMTVEDLARRYGHEEVAQDAEMLAAPDTVLHSVPSDATAWIVHLGHRDLLYESPAKFSLRVTLTDPGQTCHGPSGTFSTEFAVQKCLRPTLRVDCVLQRRFEDRITSALGQLVFSESRPVQPATSAYDPQFFGVQQVMEWELKNAGDLTSSMTVEQPLWINHTVETTLPDCEFDNDRRKIGPTTRTVRWADEVLPAEPAKGSSEGDSSFASDVEFLERHERSVFSVDQAQDNEDQDYVDELEKPRAKAKPKTKAKGKPKAKRASAKAAKAAKPAKAPEESEAAPGADDVPVLKGPTRRPRVPVPKPAGRLRGPNTSALLSDDQIKRLMLAVVITRVLTGGLDKTIDWNVVDLLLAGKFDLAVLQYRWRHMFHQNRAQVDRIEADFQNAFLIAYEEGTVPPINFDDLDNYDWLGLMKWGMKMLHSKASDRESHAAAPFLPADRETLDQQYRVTVAPKLSAKHADLLKTTSIMEKEGIMDDLCYSTPVSVGLWHKEPEPQKYTMPVLGKSKENDFEVAKTYFRASVIADEKSFDAKYARKVLETVPAESLEEARKVLSESKMVKQPPKARLIPGRNFKLHNDFKKPFNVRKDFNVFFYPAYDYKQTIDDAFASKGYHDFSWRAYEGETAALLNLVASRQVEPRIVLPPTNYEDERQFTEDENGNRTRLLSIWGFTEGTYETSKVPRERLNWEVQLWPTPLYTPGNPLPSPLPPVPAPHQDESGNFVYGRAIPVWYDIHNNFLRWVWLPLLNIVMWDLTIGAGKKANDIAKQFNGHIAVWEVTQVLNWLESIGLASRLDDGPTPGWKAEENWWLLIGHLGKDVLPSTDADEDTHMAKLDK